MKLTPFHVMDRFVDRRFKRCGLTLRTKSIDQFNIEFWASNSDKPVLVLLHAFGAKSKYSWFKQVTELSKHYRLIIPNLIYFGNSTMDPKSYHLSDQVEAIRLLLKSLNIESLTLGGASYGGVVACELALLEDFNIEKLFLSNTPTKYARQSDWDKLIREIGVDRKSDVLVPKDHKQLHQLYQRSQYKKRPVPPFVFKNIHKNMYVHHAEERRKLVDQFIADEAIYHAREYPFTFPILMIWGRADELAPVRIGEELKEHFGANAKLKVIQKSGHMPNFEQPKQYNHYLMSFLLK